MWKTTNNDNNDKGNAQGLQIHKITGKVKLPNEHGWFHAICKKEKKKKKKTW